MSMPPASSSQATERAQPRERRDVRKCALGVLLAAIALIFLFARLGHYSLWDDEAQVALSSKGIMRTGDTTAVLDHNMVAYNSGILLHNLRDRSTPPLAAYMGAVAMILCGQEPFCVRLPFALCGVAFIWLVIHWMRREQASLTMWLLMAAGIIGNVSLFLFFRQCRYYAPATLLSAVAVYLYLRWDGRRSGFVWTTLALIALFAANFLNWLALCSVMAVDYLVWRRGNLRLKAQDWAWLILPQVIAIAVIFGIWNSFLTGNAGDVWSMGIGRRLLFCWWYLRDLNFCEFGIAALLLLSPALFYFRRDPWMLRLPLALVIYVVVIGFTSPIKSSFVSEIRYLAPTIPLWIALAAVTIRGLSGNRWWLALPMAAIAFGTNLIHANWLFKSPALQIPIRCTPYEYIRELINPPTDPYRVVAQWINREVKPRESILVTPDYMAYPLMYHAPAPIYGWQLVPPADGQFKNLDPIFFVGQVPPDYIIAFGPALEVAQSAMQMLAPANAHYVAIKKFDVFWQDLYRPELFWRKFRPMTVFDHDREGIYIFKRSPASPAGP